jgi:hypothetical protein
MTITSDLAPTVTAHHGAGKQAFAHISRDESQSLIQAEMRQLSAKICGKAALLGASSNDRVQSPEDRAAIAWILRSLEDVEATIIGLSEADRRRSAAFQNRAPSPAGSPVP